MTSQSRVSFNQCQSSPFVTGILASSQSLSVWLAEPRNRNNICLIAQSLETFVWITTIREQRHELLCTMSFGQLSCTSTFMHFLIKGPNPVACSGSLMQVNFLFDKTLTCALQVLRQPRRSERHRLKHAWYPNQ